MDSPTAACWSFEYTYDGGRYSFEILADTQDEAEARVKAVANATCEGSVILDPSSSAGTPTASA